MRDAGRGEETVSPGSDRPWLAQYDAYVPAEVAPACRDGVDVFARGVPSVPTSRRFSTSIRQSHTGLPIDVLTPWRAPCTTTSACAAVIALH
jgi:hypothetical protein